MLVQSLWALLRFCLLFLLGIFLCIGGGIILLAWCVVYTWLARLMFSVGNMLLGCWRGLRGLLCTSCTASVSPGLGHPRSQNSHPKHAASADLSGGGASRTNVKRMGPTPPQQQDSMDSGLASPHKEEEEDLDAFRLGSESMAMPNLMSMRSNSRRSMAAIKWQAAAGLVQETVLKKSRK